MEAIFSAHVEMLYGGLLIVEHFENVLKAQNFEGVSDLGRESANLDVPAAVAHFFDKAHKYAQAGGRDVVELFAVDHDANAPGVHGLLNRVLELRGGVRVDKAFERDD